jgi:hypothetical protein
MIARQLVKNKLTYIQSNLIKVKSPGIYNLNAVMHRKCTVFITKAYKKWNSQRANTREGLIYSGSSSIDNFTKE